MAFVGLGGVAGSLQPTYFELLAADRLNPGLKGALVYSLSVFSQRYPWLHRILDHEDELFAGVLFLLNLESLTNSSATFSEALYGLRRVPASTPLSQPPPTSGSSSSSAAAALSSSRRLTQSQKWSSLVVSVALPYLGAKLQAAHRRAAAAEGNGVMGMRVLDYSGGGAPPSSPSSSPSSGSRHHPQHHQNGASHRGSSGSARRRLASLVRWLYPWVSLATEGGCWAYSLAYLLEAIDVHSPVLQVLGLRMSRVSGPEMAAADAKTRAARKAALVAAAKSRSLPVRWLLSGMARTGGFLYEHGRLLLLVSLFGFKFLDWWYTAAEPEIQRIQKLPPPPPPPAPAVAPGGVPLPQDPSECPLCRRPITNPALLAVSGFCFCYPCVYRHVQQHGRCPVTHAPAREEHLRSLYATS